MNQEIDFTKTVVATINGKPVTQSEFKTAFDRVANKKNWKFAIDKKIEVANDFELNIIAQAVVFFTGSVPQICVTSKPGVYHVYADGYYACIGA